MAPPQPKKPDPSAASKERNEYIPSFISQKPFYVADDSAPAHSDYLEHQRLQSSDKDAEKGATWYERGKKLAPAATKYRKGACENCGAMGHQKKDCLSRIRSVGAKYSGKDIQADTHTQNVNLSWEAKRDRWNGYDAKDHSATMKRLETLDELKQKLRRAESKADKEADGAAVDQNIDDGDRYEEETDMGRQQSTSTRNLRIREDTAKYLLNLDLESARYDPKTRSMVDGGATADASAALVAEEGFVKKSGDAAAFEAANKSAWESQERGDKTKMHLQANPTSGEVLRRKEAEEAKRRKEQQQKLLMEKYGVQDSFKRDPQKAPAITENERFVEYDQKGKIKGAKPTKVKSKYPEDIMINNHTSVWGSWWKDFKWGYACCHSTVKNSYCTGEEGKRALEEEDLLHNGHLQPEAEEIPKQIAWEEEERHEKHVPNATDDDAKALKDSKARKRPRAELEAGVSDEQMEDYQRQKMMKDDPMARHLGKDELVG